MFDKEFVGSLLCPENHMHFREADEPTIARLNRLAASGRLQDRAGRKVDQPLQAGLVREDNRVFYPIRDGIPLLLLDDGILLETP